MPFDKKTAGVKAGLEIWRIEKLEPILVDQKNHGTFYSGDCYIVMKTTQKASSKTMELHYWIGKHSSQDEQGAVAIRTVELDDMLGGKPTQHREVQEHESELFVSYFKGLQYMDGGVATAFKHVDPNAYTPRLFQVKGKRHVRVLQVEMSARSLNEGDVFILDAGLNLYQWNGKDANKYEKVKGLEMVTKIKDSERGGKAKIEFLESGKNDSDENFWKHLGGKAAAKSAAEGGSDDDVKAIPAVLYRVSDASGSMQCTKVGEGNLEKKMLDGNDVFLLDTGTEVFVWIGGKATKDERAKGMKYAQDFLTQNSRPAWTPITRLPETGETPVFKGQFRVWDEPKKFVADKKSSAASPKAAADVSALYAKQSKQAEEKMVDDGGGQITVWRIQDMKKVTVPKEQYGHFYQGDSYVILYEYKKATKVCWIIYFWQGRDSSSDEKGASAMFTIELDKQLGGDPVQVRVPQGHEPNHFLQLFKGKMIVHRGGFASAFKNRKDKDQSSVNDKGVALYHIRGTDERNTRANQVEERASSLNSGDCFACVTTGTVFVWAGKGANTSEKTFASNIGRILASGRKVQTVEEGAEPADFWTALGGKGEYPNSKDLEEGLREPRLFHCTTASTGSFKMTEVFNFQQDDLCNDDVMMLDTFAEVYVWVGHDSTKEEKDNAFKAALEFVAKAPDGRSKDTPVYRIFAGSEPPTFSCHFLGWDDRKANDFSDPYASKLKGLGSAQGAGKAVDSKSPKGGGGVERVSAGDIGYADWKTTFFSLAELQAGVPKGVDPAVKEMYLSDAEFQKLFKSDKASWVNAQKWKKDQAKKANKLF